MKVAFIGLGIMGFPMSGHLARAGLNVTVFNRTEKKMCTWKSQYPGNSAPTPAEAAHNADIIFTCVGNDDDVRSVITGPSGVLQGVKKGAILVDHTTASAQLAIELAAASQSHACHFIDAPVSGGEQGAQNGQLTIMCGGESDIYNIAAPVMQHYARQLTHMGPSGTGQLTKMVNQIAVAGVIQGLAEAIHFASSAQLDAKKVFDVISKGAAQSWQMDNRHKSMLEGEYEHGFAVNWMRKDLEICLNEARKNGSQLPVTALIDQFYGEIQAMGGGRWDTSSLLKRLRASDAPIRSPDP